jgi:hypothetical protein
MKIKLGKYGIIFYTNTFVRLGGLAFGPFVFIRPKHLDNRGLLEHELVHTRQFWNPRKWFWSKLQKEVEAYREQLKWYSEDKTRLFAEFISTRYNLDITVEEAERLLRS